jgi:hypothetical protein
MEIPFREVGAAGNPHRHYEFLRSRRSPAERDEARRRIPRFSARGSPPPRISGSFAVLRPAGAGLRRLWMTPLTADCDPLSLEVADPGGAEEESPCRMPMLVHPKHLFQFSIFNSSSPHPLSGRHDLLDLPQPNLLRRLRRRHPADRAENRALGSPGAVVLAETP